MEQKGFTLVELMITVAILGILVAIAVPAYQEYVIRTRVADGLHLASSAELAVAEYSFNANALPSTQAETGFQFTVGTPGVSSIAIGAGGVITITFNQMAGNGTVLLTPTIEASGVLTWDCTGGTLIPDYRPANCRP